MQKHPLNPVFLISGTKNILQHQKFVESLAELSEPIRIPFISDDNCRYSQPCFDEAAKLFIKLGEGCSPYHRSYPVTDYECL